jgi:hypothetical protein
VVPSWGSGGSAAIRAGAAGGAEIAKATSAVRMATPTGVADRNPMHLLGIGRTLSVQVAPSGARPATVGSALARGRPVAADPRLQRTTRRSEVTSGTLSLVPAAGSRGGVRCPGYCGGIAITGSVSDGDGNRGHPMPVDPLEGQLPRGRSLELLAEDMRLALDLVQDLRRAPIVPDRLLAARQALLMAMESYSAELTAHGLPVPPKLHGDLRLQRDLARQWDTAG